MAIDWYYLNSYLAIGVDWNYTANDDRVSSAPKVYRWDKYNTNNYGGTFSETLSPDPSGAGSWSSLTWGSGKDTREVDTFGTRNYDRKSAAFTVSLTIKWQNIGTWYGGYFHSLGSGSHTFTLNISKIPYYTPNAPLNFAAEYQSDTQTKLTWQGNYTSSSGHYPWTGVNVYRAVDGGAFSKIGTVGWSVTNYWDNSTEVGHRYDYKLRSYNPTGESSDTDTLSVYTTPATWEQLTASKSTASSVILAITGISSYYDTVEFERSNDDRATWVAISVTANADGTYTDTNPPAGTVYYRGRAVKGMLKGGWQASNSVTTVCPPSAPSITGLSGVWPVDVMLSVVWVINHPDRSEQSAAEVEVVAPNGTATTYTATDRSIVEFTPETVGSYKARVRTKGLDPDWGAWSGYESFTVAIPPSVAFTAPTAPVDVVPVEVAWSIGDTTGVSYQSIELLSSTGEVLRTNRLATGRRSYEYDATATLANETEYTVRLTVRGGSGLVTTATHKFKTDFIAPALPVVELDYTDEYACTIAITDGTPTGSQTAADSYDVTIIRSDGAQLLATGVVSGEVVIDRLPPLNTDYQYLITAYAASGSISQLYVDAHVKANAWAFNYGQDASENVVIGRYNVSPSHSATRGGTLYHFMSGAKNNLPSWYENGELDIQDDVSFVISADYLDRVEAMCDERAEGWVRTPRGGRYYCHITASYSDLTWEYLTVDAKCYRLAWREPNYE